MMMCSGPSIGDDRVLEIDEMEVEAALPFALEAVVEARITDGGTYMHGMVLLLHQAGVAMRATYLILATPFEDGTVHDRMTDALMLFDIC